MNTPDTRPCGAQRRMSFAARSAAPSLRRAAALVIALCALAQSASAASAAFAYQGVLLDENGAQLSSKNQRVEFRLYASETGGTPLWGRAFAVLLDDAGLFNTELSDDAGSRLDDAPEGATLASVLSANADKTLFIGVKVDGSSGEIEPRQKLLSVPYASVAADASAASGDFSVAGRVTAASAKVLGAVEAQSLQTSGNVSVGGNLAVTGVISGNGSIPVGCIILWSGEANTIPDGWALCDGKNGTPDLQDRFVVGAGAEYSVGATGGEKTHRLTESEMPSHRHSYTFHGADLDGSWDGDNYFYDASDHYNRDKNKNTKYTDYAGGNQPHENRPPYYALCYIMRVR